MSEPTRCGHCPWEQEILADQAAKDRARDRHIALRHPEMMLAPPVVDPLPRTGMASHAWREQGLDALAQLGLTRAEFTVFEVAELGVPEPPDPAHDWGHLARDAKHEGLIVAVTITDPVTGREIPKAVPSLRPETKGSLVKVWTAGPAALRRRSA